MIEAVLRRIRPRLVFHLAAVHFIPACDADPPRAVSINVVGTQALLEACSAVTPEAVVLASTGAVYEPSDEPHHEDSTLAPTDIYGLSKLWMEQAAGLWHRRTGVSLGVARLFNVVGPGETNPHLVPTVIGQAEASNTLRLGNLDTRRDYIDVDDIAQGLARLGERAPALGHVVCNLGTERAADGWEIVRTVADLMGRELTVETDERRLRPSDRPLLPERLRAGAE